MGPVIHHTKRRFFSSLSLLLLATLAFGATAQAWWNPEWTVRKKITVDTSAAGAGITDTVGAAEVLIRLHEGNFQFTAAREDASDLRVVAADDKTLLPFHVERFDGILSEGFVWVKVPEVKPGAQVTFWLYYGNSGESVARTDDAKATYDADTVLVYHFSEKGAPARDITTTGNNAEKAGSPVDGAIIAGGLRLTGQNPVTIAASPTLTWAAAAPLTWSAWIKPTSLAPNATIFHQRGDAGALKIAMDNGIPYVEITNADGTQKSTGTTAVEAGGWHHLAIIATSTQITLYLDGESYATLNAPLPALNGAAAIGGDVPDASGAAPDPNAPAGFVGEFDELKISKVARPASVLKLAAISQGTGDKAAKAVVLGEDEASAHGGENELTKHLMLIADISKDLTFDGWVVIFLCTILAIVGWVITAMKFMYLNRINKATRAFLIEWRHVAVDFSSLDHGDEEHVKSMGGKLSSKAQKLMHESPLYHIFQIGSSEIQHRVVNAKDNFRGLSERSMHAIRVTLDGGLVREVQRLNSNLVFLTIGIAGGPYLGLLGTVIGVMITFAVIAKSGAVEVNSIAPGIAGALLATVAGLAVAIPALFAYSYISSRIKDAVSEMQIFIDEFVAKIAESFPAVED